jgi:hypothetical protein
MTETALDRGLTVFHQLSGVAKCVDIVATNLEEGEWKTIPEIEALGYLCAQLNVGLRELGSILQEPGA